MASWSDVPTEIKLLIIRHYINRVLFINLSGSSNTFRTAKDVEAAKVDAATDQIYNLATAYPAACFDVLEFLYTKLAELMEGVSLLDEEEDSLIDEEEWKEFKQNWRFESWPAFHYDVECLVDAYRFGLYSVEEDSDCE